MMTRRVLLALMVAALSTVALQQASAQEQEHVPYKAGNYFDLAASASGDRFSAAASWSHMHGLGRKKQRLQIGYGLRFTGFVAANQFYTTAPAKYTSPTQSIGTLFSKTLEENIDTITTATASTYSLNAALYAHYRLSRRWDVGFNIDVIGFSFGPERKFNIISSTFDPNQAPVQRGAPTRFNLLLTSDNDIGSLNSEFFVRYWLREKVGLRLGYTFLFSEYRTDEDLRFDNRRIVNDRYRHKAGMVLLAVTFRPFANL